MKKIITAVNKKIKETFPEKTVSSTAFHINMKPGTFVVTAANVVQNATANLIEKTGTIRINYFPANPEDHRGEFLDVQDKLCASFFLKLKITDTFVVPITSLEFEETEDVLIASFNVLIREFIEETGEDAGIIETEVK